MTTTLTRAEQAWQLLEGLSDPEIPVITLRELGILRDVREGAQGLEVVITPTYSGCPAMGQIEDDVKAALATAGLQATVVTQLAPAWTTDWMSDEAKADPTHVNVVVVASAWLGSTAEPMLTGTVMGLFTCPFGPMYETLTVIGACVRDELALRGPALDCAIDADCPCGAHCDLVDHTCRATCMVPPVTPAEACALEPGRQLHGRLPWQVRSCTTSSPNPSLGIFP